MIKNMKFNRYQIGFFFSMVLTALSFGAVALHYHTHHSLPSHTALFWIILALAVIQLAVQLVYFLHVGKESKTRDMLALCLAAVIVIFVVSGSLWIMANLTGNSAIPYDNSIPAVQNEQD